jgi:hypothetical protein
MVGAAGPGGEAGEQDADGVASAAQRVAAVLVGLAGVAVDGPEQSGRAPAGHEPGREPGAEPPRGYPRPVEAEAPDQLTDCGGPLGGGLRDAPQRPPAVGGGCGGWGGAVEPSAARQGLFLNVRHGEVAKSPVRGLWIVSCRG